MVPGLLTRFLVTLNRILIFFLVAFGALGLIFLVVSPHFLNAWEDAVILFAYSTNLATTGVISFFPHGPPAEGATDFLWMIMLAAGRWIGIDLYYLANFISAVAVLGIAFLLLKMARQRIQPGTLLLIAGLIFLAPQTWAVVGGFSVFPFTALITLMVWFLTEQRLASACITAFALCLFRPDGVVFALPLLGMFLFADSRRPYALRVVSIYFLLPGLIYFLWRWHYFSEFLPLPFLVKSDAPRIAGLFVKTSLMHGGTPVGFALFLIGISCGSVLKSRTNLKLLLALIVIPTLFYFHMRLDQNVGDRFFFFPLLSIGILLALNWNVVEARARVVLPVALVLWAVFFLRFWLSMAAQTAEYRPWPGISVPHELANLPGRGTMITTEAGVVPYYTHWVTYDAWGLNTARFAHKILQPSDVVDLHPDLVVLHPTLTDSCDVDPSSWPVPYSTRTWEHMERNLITGVHRLSYEVWLEPRPEIKLHRERWGGHVQPPTEKYICWYVNKRSIRKEAIESILRSNGIFPAVSVPALNTTGK